MSSLENALSIIATYHSGQLEIDGKTPYVSHLIHVAANLDSVDEKIVALLHDVVEDTEMTIAGLVNWGFSEEIVEAIDALTKLSGENYLQEYIPRVSRNKLASVVKLADLKHNSDTSRLGRAPLGRDVNRHRKYQEAITCLEMANISRR